jgi:hypothetical protein
MADPASLLGIILRRQACQSIGITLSYQAPLVTSDLITGLETRLLSDQTVPVNLIDY